MHQIEGEAVGGAWGNPELAGESRRLHSGHGFPQGLAGVADLIGIVEHQQIEVIGAAALQRELGGALDELEIFLRAAQLRIGETRVALAALALTLVEIVADHADKGVARAVDPGQSLAEKLVGLSISINIRGDEGAYPRIVCGSDAPKKTLFRESLAEMHEASAAPGAVSCGSDFHNGSVRFLLKLPPGATPFASRNGSAAQNAQNFRKSRGKHKRLARDAPQARPGLRSITW